MNAYAALKARSHFSFSKLGELFKVKGQEPLEDFEEWCHDWIDRYEIDSMLKEKEDALARKSSAKKPI